jgi:hypothetical protein
MRKILAVFLVMLAVHMGSQNVNADEPDVYSLALVEHVLRVQGSGQKVLLSATVKNIPRLGDGVSIALFKILDAKELLNPVTILQFLPIIRDSFSQPEIHLRRVKQKAAGNPVFPGKPQAADPKHPSLSGDCEDN